MNNKIPLGRMSHRSRRNKLDNSKAARAPLHELDSETQTYGCRHTNPDSCKKNLMEGVCAFVRDDKLCLSPPGSWPRIYQDLIEELEGSGEKDEESSPAAGNVSRVEA